MSRNKSPLTAMVALLTGTFIPPFIPGAFHFARSREGAGLRHARSFDASEADKLKALSGSEVIDIGAAEEFARPRG